MVPILVKTTSTAGGGIAIKNRDDVTSLYKEVVVVLG